jgi:hypothetical protein
VVLHFYVVAGNETLFAIKLRPIPIHIVFHVENFQHLLFTKAQLIVGCCVEVMLCDSFHCYSHFMILFPGNFFSFFFLFSRLFLKDSRNGHKTLFPLNFKLAL